MKLVAHHTPVPVSLHWQDEVKSGLDKDVKQGVIESVLIGEPVTWCRRMRKEEWQNSAHGPAFRL